MDRELVLAVLAALLCGGAVTVCAPWPATSPMASDSRIAERRAWRRLWMPFLPALLIMAALLGWALREPANAERVPNPVLACALPFAALFLRAAWRALRALGVARQNLPAAPVGLLRPRIVISPQLRQALDAAAVDAVLEHEKAHARHFDPLRLWLAQAATDVLWPWPSARSRLMCWKRALELARDDEARLRGASGPDLAAAILAVLRANSGASQAAAMLGGDQAFVQHRVARLLRPLNIVAPQKGRGARWLLAAAAVFALSVAVATGSAFGEHAVRVLLGLT